MRCVCILSLLLLFSCDSAGSILDGQPDGSQGGLDAFTPSNEVVFAHTKSALYKVDPITLTVTKVGDFNFAQTNEVMTDIGIDKDGTITGISGISSYSVNSSTGQATLQGSLGGAFNGASYLPDPSGSDQEILIATGFQTGNVSRISGATAEVIGAYGNGYTSSGDITYIEGFGALATVKHDDHVLDVLVSVDPQTLEATEIGVTNHAQILGVGFYGDKMFGFTAFGEFILINPANGNSRLVERFDFEWWGAGVTTSVYTIE